MGGINIKKSKTLEVLSMKIQCDVRWNRFTFQCLNFLRRGRISPSSYYLHHFHPKENDIQLQCEGASRYILSLFDLVQVRATNNLLMMAVYPTLLIHGSTVAMWLMFNCHHTIDLARAK